MTAYTGKCGQYKCEHALSAHAKDGRCLCTHKKCQCAGYQPVVDQEKYNSIDGKPAITLYKFQEEYIRGLPPRYIMAADTGTGKTWMALAHYDQHAYLKPLLVLAPAAKVSTGDWQRDIDHYFEGRLAPEYEVYTYEKFSRMPTPAQYAKNHVPAVFKQWLQRYPNGFAVIADEVHKVKNPQSQMGKAMFAITPQADFFVGLSATPLPNGWQDAANYFKLFGLTKNKTEFKKRYVDEVNFKGFPEIRGYFHEDELQRHWNSIAKPLSKDKALDLPPLTYVPVPLQAGSLYSKVQKDRIFEDKFLDNPSAFMHALRQSLVEPKVKWLDEFLEGVSGHTLIFYNYKSERDAILEMLAKRHKTRKVFRQDGEVHEVPSKHQWADLPPRTITLAQYQSGGTGIEIQYAATTVYFSPTYSYQNYEQSVGRTYRNGQVNKCTLYLLCAPASIERDIWSALRNKQDFSETQWYQARLDNGEIAKGAIY